MTFRLSDFVPLNDYPGAVFCLYAQVLQKQDKKSISAKENWQKCLKLSQGKVLNIEEDQWLFEARKQSKK